MRIWTALLAGACAALVSTLVGAAALGLLSFAAIEREALSDPFLLAWLAMTILCAVPGNPLGQWLAMLRVSSILLGGLCFLALLTTRDPVTLIVTAVFAGLLALLDYALGKPGINRNSGR